MKIILLNFQTQINNSFILLFFLFLFLIFQFGCNKSNCESSIDLPCVEEEFTEEILLTDSIKNLFPFEEGDILVFKNMEGTEKLFKIRNTSRNVFEEKFRSGCVVCVGGVNQFEVRTDFFNRESIIIAFSNIHSVRPSFFFSHFINSQENHGRNRLFYEQLEIGDFKDNPDQSLLIIPAIYEFRGVFSEGFIEDRRQYEYSEEILMQNHIFKNVYSSCDDASEVTVFYFSFEDGLIGFEASDEVWLFDGVK